MASIAVWSCQENHTLAREFNILEFGYILQARICDRETVDAHSRGKISAAGIPTGSDSYGWTNQKEKMMFNHLNQAQSYDKCG